MMDILPENIIITTFDPNPKAEGWRAERNTGVIIVHKPSAISVSHSGHSSVHENRISAMADLRHRVDAWKEAKSSAISDSANAVRATKSVQTLCFVPNPDNIDLVQLRKNYDEGILNSRVGIIKALDYAISLEKAVNARLSMITVYAGGGGGEVQAGTVYPVVPGFVGGAGGGGAGSTGERVAEIDTDKESS